MRLLALLVSALLCVQYILASDSFYVDEPPTDDLEELEDIPFDSDMRGAMYDPVRRKCLTFGQLCTNNFQCCLQFGCRFVYRSGSSERRCLRNTWRPKPLPRPPRIYEYRYTPEY